MESVASSVGKRIVKWVLGIAAGVFLGALGNAFYDYWMKAVLVDLAGFTLGLVGHFWSGYIDTLHSNVGSLRIDQYSRLTLSVVASGFVVFLVLVSATQWLAAVDARRDSRVAARKALVSRSVKPLPDRVHTSVSYFSIALAALTVATFFMRVAEASYERKAIVWAERSLDIVAPHISPERRIELRAELRAVNSAKRYYAFYSVVTSIAAASGTELPAFVPLGYVGS